MEKKTIAAGLVAVIVIGAAGFTLLDVNLGGGNGGADDGGDNGGNSGEMLPEPGNGTTVYFFWGDGCPYCAEEKQFLEELDSQNDDLKVKMYEVYYSERNQELFRNTAELYGTSARGVPATFLGQEYWRGYNERTGTRIEQKVEECLEQGCESPLER
ncbi:MAG: thioredoxin family protein [Candidatus Nanohaloarchaeota archaeon QJJ-7]|nr:thioredoxin family protein [Candidatus Nanohaloarchaeota archaeon QJJ-7]